MQLFNRIIVIIITTFFFVGCTKTEKEIRITPDFYHSVVDKLSATITHDVFSPPVASRVYAYPNTAAFETLNNHKGKGLNTFLNEKSKFKIETIKPDDNVNLKLSSTIAFLEVAKELVFSGHGITNFRDSLYQVWKNQNQRVFQASKEYGEHYGKEIIKWMNSDNYSETRTLPEYNIAKNEGDISKWTPTPPSYMDAIEPHWNKIRPFILNSADQFKPKTHPEFSMKSESDFYKELLEVYDVDQKIRKIGDDSDEIAIAQFWDCNPYVSVTKGHYMFAKKKITPGGHWIGICKIACRNSNSDFETTVNAYTKTSIAIADAFISCWDEKYRSNLVRPETLIKKYIDDSWEPILQTPPFPEYTSGHSVVSGSASEVLTMLFGDNFKFNDDTEVPYGLPIRSFSSFKKAAEEAAVSRLYGGIHYRAAIDEGLKQGRNVGGFISKALQ